MKSRPKCFPKFARQFGKACGDFRLVEDDASDRFLVVLDRDLGSQTLLWWMNYKRNKAPRHFELLALHLYSSDMPDSVCAAYLTEFCKTLKITLEFEKVCQPADFNAYIQTVARIGIARNCNKIALPDSIDWMNASVLSSMANEAVYGGPSPAEDVKVEDLGEIKVCRPFCYCSDDAIEEWGTVNEYEGNPTGIRVEKNEFMDLAVQALGMLRNVSTNHRMNFFSSRFSIEKKYLGVGAAVSEIQNKE
jgi:hypothetical protein